MVDAKTNLYQLLEMLENKTEDVICILMGSTKVQLSLIPQDESKRLGAAKDIVVSDDFDEVFDSLDSEVTKLFGGELG